MKPSLLLSAAALLCLLGTPHSADAAKRKSKQQAEAEAKQAEAEAKRAEAEAKKAEAEAKRAEAEAKKAQAEAAAEKEESPRAGKKKPKSNKASKSKKAPRLEDESDDVEVEIEDASAEELAQAEASSEVELEEAPAEPEEPEEDEESSSGTPLNWLSFSIQQDALFFGTQPNVCGTNDAMGAFVPGPDEYSCHGPNGVYQGPIYSGVGNEVKAGIGFATFRLMLGYDRLFINRLLLGGRLGYAFGGEPGVPLSDGFMPFHAELKAQYYFGDAPFERRGFRPYAAAAIGLAEVDASVNVDYFVDAVGYQNGEKGSFQVWRKAGTVFGALSGGAAYPLGPGQVHAELRLLIMLGNPAIGTALNLGYAYGL